MSHRNEVRMQPADKTVTRQHTSLSQTLQPDLGSLAIDPLSLSTTRPQCNATFSLPKKNGLV